MAICGKIGVFLPENNFAIPAWDYQNTILSGCSILIRMQYCKVSAVNFSPRLSLATSQAVPESETCLLNWSTTALEKGTRSDNNPEFPYIWCFLLQWLGPMILAPSHSSQWMQQWLPSLWPCPCQSWQQCWCRGQLPHVLSGFLGARLVQRPVKLNKAPCVTCIAYYYYLL